MSRLWPQLTGEETLDLFGHLHGSYDDVLRRSLVDRFALDPTVKVRAYSKGNRQKVLLIGALMTRADLLLLDEPTAGLDPLMEHEFQACIREARGRGQTVLLSSHLLGEVEALCDRVATLRGGRLVEVATIAELRPRSSTRITASFAGPPPTARRFQA